MSILVCLLELLLCSTASAEFPIGMYGVTDAADIRLLGQAGFTSFQTYIREPKQLAILARASREAGLSMLAPPDSINRTTWTDVAKSWPMVAWYLTDEPDVQKMPAKETCARADAVRPWSTAPTTLVVGQGSAAATYAECPDIMMIDWYPVPHLPLESVAQHLDLTVNSAKGKPVWAVLQAFDWRDYPQGYTKRSIGRFPDHKEIRFMTYLSILHGADGIFYYNLAKPSGKTLFDFPEEWQALSRVIRELSALRPTLQYGHPLPLPFSKQPDDLEAMAWRHRMKDYVVILNRRSDALLRIPETLLSPRWRPLFEARRDVRDALVVRNGAFYLEPYRVLVFEGRSEI